MKNKMKQKMISALIQLLRFWRATKSWGGAISRGKDLDFNLTPPLEVGTTKWGFQSNCLKSQVVV
jgi:hypothetical protein